eukprot:95011-Rhodomonas_salina.1
MSDCLWIAVSLASRFPPSTISFSISISISVSVHLSLSTFGTVLRAYCGTVLLRAGHVEMWHWYRRKGPVELQTCACTVSWCEACIWHVGMYRDPKTLVPVEYYNRFTQETKCDV